MTCMAVNDKFVVLTKGLHIDCYDHSTHKIINTPLQNKLQESDVITDLSISSDSKYLAYVTSNSKQLIIYDLPFLKTCTNYILPRSASKLRFTVDNQHVLVADKCGDVLIYDIIKSEDTGTKLLGHLSLLLDVLQTKDSRFIISCDRDEKIKVSCYPNTYNIKTYCLGHKEFVNHIELLPHNCEYLTSTSGDGTIKFWNYVNGILVYSIDTFLDINEGKLKETFIKEMDEDGIEVNSLPIVHYTLTRLNETSSLVVVAVHSCNILLVYTVKTLNKQFSHMLETKLTLERFPSSIQLYNLSLFVYDHVNTSVIIYNVLNNQKLTLEFCRKIYMFEDKTDNVGAYNSQFIKVLFKRKFNNVQEYQNRKKQRLEKSLK